VEPLARKAAETVVTVVDDEGLYLLIAELMRALGDSQVDIFFHTSGDSYCLETSIVSK
jgi:hypothetical protein